jgi:sRNA-binding regulator protein Hfq
MAAGAAPSKTIGEIARDRAMQRRPRFNLPPEPGTSHSADAKPEPPRIRSREEESESYEPDRLLWSRARRENLSVIIEMQNGTAIRGLVRSYGRYSVGIETDKGLVVVFKSAMATVAGVVASL